MTHMGSGPRLLLSLACFVAIGLWATSCQTVDVDPIVFVGLDSLPNARISENGGRGYIMASLNGASKKDVRVSLNLNGTAQKGFDYKLSAEAITIPAGQLSGTVEITALQDNLLEGDETVIITLGSVENAGVIGSDSLIITISDDDVDTDHDGLPDAIDGCPLDSGSVANGGCPEGFGLVINEVLYDPASDITGDANGDGIRDAQQDEFIEIYNNTTVAQNIGNYTVNDIDSATGQATPRFTFPAGTMLQSHKAVVVFGGGTPTGSFGGSQVFTASNSAGLSFGNSLEFISVSDAVGNEILRFNSNKYSNNPDESYTRNPDVTGDYVQHHMAAPGKLFSPGTKADGSPF